MEAHDREAELLNRAIAGDEAALERLMLSNHGRLASGLERKLPQNMRGFIAVEDVLQETYVRVFREITRFQPRGPGSFHAWLARIAENQLFDAIKAERAAKRGGGRARIDSPAQPAGESVVEWLELLAVHERTPSLSAAGHEALTILEKAMQSIKEDYREALRLRYVEGLPVAEAAARMKRSEGAVCLLCHRGLRRLREQLGSSTQFFMRDE